MRAYRAFERHGVLPIAGGYLEQEKWILEDFATIAMLDELARIEADLPKVTSEELSRGFSGL